MRPCLLPTLVVLGILTFVVGQSEKIVRSLTSGVADFSALQLSAQNWTGSPIVLYGSRRFLPVASTDGNALDLNYQSSTMLLLASGAAIEITMAKLTGVRLTQPSSSPFRLMAVSVQPSASLLLSNVVLETDCGTLRTYQEWYTAVQPANISLSSSGDLHIVSWQQPDISLSNCTLNCQRPPTLLRTSLYNSTATRDASSGGSLGSGNSSNSTDSTAPANTTTTVVVITSQLDLYNALWLAPSYNGGFGSVLLLVRCSMALTSPLWSAQGVTLRRNVSIVGSVYYASLYGNDSIAGALANSSSSSGDGSSISDVWGDAAACDAGSWVLGKPVLDLQDLTGVVHTSDDSVVLSLRGLALSNAGMVFGYAPVPYSSLGLVSSLLWFFDVVRSLAPRPPYQLQLSECDIISYAQDIEHLTLWAAFLTATAGPLAAVAEPYRLGVSDIVVDKTVTTALRFTELTAYGVSYQNVSIAPQEHVLGLLSAAASSAATTTDATADGTDSSSDGSTGISTSSSSTGSSAAVVGVPLTARHPPQALYRLNIPFNTTAVAVWSQNDMQAALADVQRLPPSGCSSRTNTTAFLLLFQHISLDAAKWPAGPGGFSLPCNVTISGINDASAPDGTVLNYNLLPRFASPASGAFLTLRSLTLINMPSQRGTYDLTDLTQMTLPLWPVGRSAGAPTAPLILRDSTLVLPPREYELAATTLLRDPTGSSGSSVFPLRTMLLNGSVNAVVSSSAQHKLTLSCLTGLNMSATNLVIADTTSYSSYGPLLDSIVYGTGNVSTQSPLPPSPSSSLGRHDVSKHHCDCGCSTVGCRCISSGRCRYRCYRISSSLLSLSC
ncbi:hypothetical protein Agub_g7848 [Astrephomene gubernaculifera]|uniref:Membrane-associated protein n=1 Tax=Astrephomene gubernaculifera TaxID=47775 RepID=A0AAD3DSN2_9CHLO|nr:hypothetical protein Agub_g7848 [Astrephomene gubernaculifera]